MTLIESFLFVSVILHFNLIHSRCSARTRLSLCSLLVQASMKVWAITDSEASTTSDTWMSKIKLGFFRMFTQKRRGRLQRKRTGKQRITVLFQHQINYHFDLLNEVLNAGGISCENTSLRVQSGAGHGNNRDGEEAFFYMSVYLERFLGLALNITISYQTDLPLNHCSP